MSIQLQWFMKGLHNDLRPLCASDRGLEWESVEALAQHAYAMQQQLLMEREVAKTQAGTSQPPSKPWSTNRKPFVSFPKQGESRPQTPTGRGTYRGRQQQQTAAAVHAGTKHGQSQGRGNQRSVPGGQRSGPTFLQAVQQLENSAKFKPDEPFGFGTQLSNAEALQLRTKEECFYCGESTAGNNHRNSQGRVACPTRAKQLAK